jgi:predicted TIM-barrel fold metal-dependent hydrolase
VDRPDFCLSNDYRYGVSLLEKYGLTLELQGFPNQFTYFSELISDNPGVNFCLVHGGLLTSDDDDIFEKWKTALLPLINYENVFIKCSATQLFSFGGVSRSQRQISRQYNMLLDFFGADRCFFGSNFPVEKLKSTYSDMMNIYIEAIKNRPEEDQIAFFHNTAERFYRL